MKNRKKTGLIAIVLCLAMILTLMPTLAFAETGEPVPGGVQASYEMVEGEVVKGIVPAGTNCLSTDPSVAWVDEAGNLNALKAGTATITVPSDEGEKTSTITVGDFSDGSETVGKLKILARYNDSMDFYDGHVYLLFTSYQDGVQISLKDPYGAYAVADQYYKDIRTDISYGSNHNKETSADDYFTFDKKLKKMTLNRGEIVTFGMYRDFDLTIPQAALGMLENSTVWGGLVSTGKTAVVTNLIQYLMGGKVSPEEALEKMRQIIEENGGDPEKWMDGFVKGGVCMNRELYNQKLEWDQYENVTYELDITKNQLDRMLAAMNGNLNKFNVMKNSCATIALKAWNAAVGTRPDGSDSAYKLSAQGEGIFMYMDAPAGVKQNIMKRLPGYYLNNAENVAEPDASFVDETGCVYVSAPEKVAPVVYTYEDPALQIDESRTKMADIVNIAKTGKDVVYNQDAQETAVNIAANVTEGVTTVSSIGFTTNGVAYSYDGTQKLADGIWFKVPTGALDPGVHYYVTDADGNALPGYQEDESYSFRVDQIPASFKTGSGQEGFPVGLTLTIKNEDKISGSTDAYYYNGAKEKVSLQQFQTLPYDTAVYIKSLQDEEDQNYFLNDITYQGKSYLDPKCFDAEENAYVIHVADTAGEIRVEYETGEIQLKQGGLIQAAIGDELDVKDFATLLVGEKKAESDKLQWEIVSQPEEGTVEFTDETKTKIVCKKDLSVGLWIHTTGHLGIGEPVILEIHKDSANMVPVTILDDDGSLGVEIVDPDSENTRLIPFSGYLVEKGTVLKVRPGENAPDESVIAELRCNGKKVGPGETITADQPVEIKGSLRKAVIKGMPDKIKFTSKGESYQLKAKVQYKDLPYSLLPVYDSSITYHCSDPLVSVDENGKIVLAGDVPEEGKAVFVIAVAGSSRDVVATTKVCIGDYQGERTVGRLTVSARQITNDEPVGHGCLTFTTYEDTDMNISYYDYYRPNEKYIALMEDYEKHPENYSQDPALCDDSLDIPDRSSYFDVIKKDMYAEPEKIHLNGGESLSVSYYSDDNTSHLELLLATLVNGTIAKSDSTKAFLTQLILMQIGMGDAVAAFDSGTSMILEMFMTSIETGHNPADGASRGGLAVNKESYNQFRRHDSQMPNDYYSVEITADELAMLQMVLENKDRNYYSLFNMNCASAVADLWNLTLSDRDGYNLNPYYSIIAADTESLYAEIERLSMKTGLEGDSGYDFYPRPLPTGHRWGIEASGDTLTAKCVSDNRNHIVVVPSTDRKEYPLTIKADDCRYSHVLLEGLDAFNEIMGTNVAANADYVRFYKVDLSGIHEVPEGTNDVGVYVAELMVNGQIARTGFSILPTEVEPEVILPDENYPYDGKVHTPKPVVKVNGEVLDPSMYTVTYGDGRKEIGTYRVQVDLNLGTRYFGTGRAYFEIVKAANKITKITSSKALKAATLKKKAQSFTISATVKEKAKKTFAVSKWNTKTAKKYFKVTKAGKVTVKKGTPKGTYKFTVKITAAATKHYAKTTATKTITVKVK